MNIVNILFITFVPGGWIGFMIYKLYTLLIKRSSNDTNEIYYLLSDLIMMRKGRHHRPFVGSYIKLTDDISIVKEINGELVREYKC